jgi:hypothetical protein
VNAATLADAGYQHGKLARQKIETWFNTSEMQGLFAFVEDSALGKQALASMKHDNTARFPQYVEELEGIARGAAVPADRVWVANLIMELEAIMPANSAPTNGHCSDIYGTTSKGKVVHGHNEDWSKDVSPLWYFLSIEPTVPNAFSAVAGLAYPGTLLGYAPTWSKRGIYSTQNSLFPKQARARGLGCVFVQRDAMDHAVDIPSFVARLATAGWADTASMNIIDVNVQRMANVELYEDDMSVRYIDSSGGNESSGGRGGNYSHFNMYKHLASGMAVDRGDISTQHRQARWDGLPPVSTLAGVVAVLGDTADPKYPVYRPITLATLVLDGESGNLTVWANARPGHAAPVYNWNIKAFFARR